LLGESRLIAAALRIAKRCTGALERDVPSVR
jgi:hypothetical protein